MSELLPPPLEKPPLTPEVAMAVLDVLEVVSRDIQKRIEEVALSDPGALADKETMEKFVLASAETKGNSQTILMIREYIRSQFPSDTSES